MFLLYFASKRSFETLVTIFELISKEKAREDASLSCITTNK